MVLISSGLTKALALTAAAAATVVAWLLLIRLGGCRGGTQGRGRQSRKPMGRPASGYQKDPLATVSQDWHPEEEDEDCPECDAELLYAQRARPPRRE